MAWNYISTGGMNTDASGNFTMFTPSNTLEGDLIIACIAYRGTAGSEITIPAGWTIIEHQTDMNTTANTSASSAAGLMCYIIRGASDPSYAFTRTGGDQAHGFTLVYRNSSGEPFLNTSSSTKSTSLSTVTNGGITTVDNNELIIGFLACARNGNTDLFTMDAATTPSIISTTSTGGTTTEPTADTWLKRVAVTTSGGSDVAAFVADGLVTSPSSTGTVTATAIAAGLHTLIVAAFSITPFPNVGYSYAYIV
jgi:hypothetical protein